MSGYCYAYPRPAVHTDVVVFSVCDTELKALLTRGLDGQWSLPGGLAQTSGDLDASALDQLADQTNIDEVYLEQLYTFGQADGRMNDWLITVAYYALLPSERLPLMPVKDNSDTGWFGLNEIASLVPVQHEIISMARQRLAAKLSYSTIGFQFLPEEFTLSELQSVYEIILNEKQDKRNFRKWILSLGQIEESGKERRSGAHRPARLYQVKRPGKVEIIK